MDTQSIKDNATATTATAIHATTEQIPPLQSAPPSGAVFTAESLNNKNNNNVPAAPSSGKSWASWGVSESSSVGSLLEKAGQLAYSTVGTAADLAGDYLIDGVSYGESGVASGGSDNTANSIVSNNDSSSKHGSNDGKLANMMATPDSSAHPLVSSPTKKIQPMEGQTITEHLPPPVTPTQLNIDMFATHQPVAPSALSPSRQSSTANEQLGTTQHSRRRRASANPPVTTLAARQSHLKVLVVPTADAQSIATKNNTTLSEMFRVYGNSNSQKNDKYEPPLPPFRSAHRSILLQWDQLVLDFVSNQDMEASCVPEVEAERALGEASRLWDEDRTANGEGDDDLEMNQLEKCVVDSLAEEEEEERIRERDGIPSMSSLPPSRSPSYYEGEEGDSEDNILSFGSKREEALKACADTAFALTSLSTASWLLRFRHTLDCCTDGMNHEMLSNPSVVILTASTSENYLICFAELANVHHLPRPYHDGRYDPNGLRREFLLLHDVVNGPKNFDESRALAQMKERFGSGCCSVLRLNSTSPSADLLDDYSTVDEDGVWESIGPSSPFVQNTLSDQYNASMDNFTRASIRGACLSDTDKRAIRRYVANMVSTGLVPAVERRIANLNSAVTNAKRGVKNVIKSFWRKPKESLLTNVSGYGDSSASQKDSSSVNEPTTSGSVKYRFDSIESQTRLLADTLFLMRDYDAALGVYRLVKDDYKHDKAMLYYASVQEMIVLCMYMLDPYGRDGRFASDVHHSIETALYSYTRAADEEKESDNNTGVRPGEAPRATRLATRLCLVLSATRSLCEGKQMEIADLLASASSHETPLGAAVLLEQSSAHYYRAGLIRKYAFHMLMAGHMFRSAGQERHAFRCFSASLYVYHGERWEELRSHLRSALAAQLYGMKRYALSMQFYAKLVGAGGGRVSVRSQQKFINHIVDICKDHPSSALVAIDRMSYSGSEESEGNDVSGTTPTLEDVLKGFTDAARDIEISNIGFPRVEDTSLKICAENTRDSSISFGRSDSFVDNGTGASSKGDELVWQDMTNCAEAELRASAISSVASTNGNAPDEGGPEPPPVHSGDETIDRVIMEIDKEERDAEYRERQKRKGKVGSPEVRATSEPLAVSFSLSNPLGLEVSLTDMQLVASLSCHKTGTRHTNEFAVTEGKDSATKLKNRTFHGSQKEYQRPEFICQLPMNTEHLSDVTSTSLSEEAEPYFVVTKSALKMAPNSNSNITLNVCPLAEGDFQVVGVRFKLIGEVWIFHRFDLPGTLLQDTRVNKSRRGECCCAFGVTDVC